MDKYAVNQYLIDFTEAKGFNRNQIANEIRLDRPDTIYNIFDKKVKVSTDILVKFANRFPEFDANRALRGIDYESISNTQPEGKGSVILNIDKKLEEFRNEIKKIHLVETVDNAGRPNIPLVDTPAFGGYIRRSNEPEFFSDKPTFSIPDNSLRNGTFRAFRIDGNSMSPKISNGDISIGEHVDNWAENIKDGMIYIVVLENDIVCKRVINRIIERGKLRLKSDNYNVQDYEVAAESVREVWRWKCNITFDGSNPFFDLYEWNQKLENQIFDLAEELRQFKKKGK